MSEYDQNLASINEMLTKVSNSRHVWTIGVNKLGDGVHYYLAIEDANSDDKRNVVELVPSKADKEKHIIKLHCDNYDIDNMSGLEAGELAGILQISAILLLSVDYGYLPKGGAMNIKNQDT